MATEQERATIRFEVRRALRGLVQEAWQQGCIEDVRRFPEVFLVCVSFLDVVVSDAIEQGVVTWRDLSGWLDVLLAERGKDGTAVV